MLIFWLNELTFSDNFCKQKRKYVTNKSTAADMEPDNITLTSHDNMFHQWNIRKNSPVAFAYVSNTYNTSSKGSISSEETGRLST